MMDHFAVVTFEDTRILVCCDRQDYHWFWGRWRKVKELS